MIKMVEQIKVELKQKKNPLQIAHVIYVVDVKIVNHNDKNK